MSEEFKFKTLFDYPKYRKDYDRSVPFLPMSRKEMDQLGWDSCDIILVTGDAYVDHPSFAMAILGRFLEHYGYRVGIISQNYAMMMPILQETCSENVLTVPPLYIRRGAANPIMMYRL